MLPDPVAMIGQLIATPSVSSPDARFDQSNRGVVDLVAEWASVLGFSVRIQALPGESGKVNLIAALGEGDDGLVLSGHTDTVPYDAERWTDDPFTLTEREGKLFGLGTADMKGFFAAALHAVARFEPSSLRRPITLLGTADEESTMDGARALAEAGERIINLERILNLRYGAAPEDDCLPERFVRQEVTDDAPTRGMTVDIVRMVADFNSAMGWDDEGRPQQSKLVELSLEEWDLQTRSTQQR